MGLFKNDNRDNSNRPRNPDNYFMFKLLGAGYLLYLVYDIIKMYIAGGEDQPSVFLLVLSIVVLGGGAIFIAVHSFLQWRRHKREAAEEELLAQQLLEEEERSDEEQAEAPVEETEE